MKVGNPELKIRTELRKNISRPLRSTVTPLWAASERSIDVSRNRW